MNNTVAERLVAFALEQARAGVPGDVSHEAKRLLLNQLKASVGATEHEAVRILHDWSAATGGEGDAAVLWFGTRMEPGRAAMVNGALFEVLDFHDTYIPCFMHATSAVLPAVLAAAQAGGNSGEQAVQALAIGMEVEMACARLLMPTGYYRGFVPAGLVGGVGAATACSLLAELDAERMRNAIAIAMCTAFGAYESVGSMTLPYITGATAMSGLTAAQLAGRGLDAPATAFEGDKGMRESYSDPEILALRSRIELVRDETRRSFEGCSMEIEFTDGTRESTSVDAFLGSPARRMSDEELAWIFCGSAEPVLPAGRAEEILDAVWNLDKAADIGSLMSLCRLN